MRPSDFSSCHPADSSLHSSEDWSTRSLVTIREQPIRMPFADPPATDPDMIALWLFALLGDSEELLVQYLEQWPQKYRSKAQA